MLLARRLFLHHRSIRLVSHIGHKCAGSTGSTHALVVLQPLRPVLAAHSTSMAAAATAAAEMEVCSSSAHAESMPAPRQQKRQKRPPLDGPRCVCCNSPCRDAGRMVLHMRKCCMDLLPAHLRAEPQPRKRPKGLLNGQHAAFIAADPVLSDEELQQLLVTAKQQEDALRQQILHLLYIDDNWVPSNGSVLDGDATTTARLSSQAEAGKDGSRRDDSTGTAATSGRDVVGSNNDVVADVASGADGSSASHGSGVERAENDASMPAAQGRTGSQPLHHGTGKRRKTPEQLASMLGLPMRRVEHLLVRAPKAIPLAIDNDPLEILYEDDALLAVAKPPGVCSAPAHRFAGGTMVNRIAGYLGVPQPHVLHRLDMNTSGVLLVAKGVVAARICHEQFEQKTVTKEYLALCIGGQRAAGTAFSIDAAIGAHPHMKVARAVVETGGQPALTHFEVLSSSSAAMPVLEGSPGEVADASVLATSKGACLIRCRPVTGRTHQIRLHLAAAGHPLVGDEVYGVHQGPWLNRQALHAWRLTVQHPDGSGPITFSAPPPPDFVAAAGHLGLDLTPVASNAGIRPLDDAAAA